MLPKSNEDLKARAQTIAGQKQVSAVRIDVVNQSEPNAQGLIPIEVQGVIAVHSAEGFEGPRPFRFQFLVGQNAQSKLPVVAAFQEVRAGGF
ncbi:MAG: hypothetical protein HY711_02415 [Candidatus Melainabacteria bacterium]|nr:hypothetical protein [Candidatus Melainabacteria bacterium]